MSTSARANLANRNAAHGVVIAVALEVAEALAAVA